MKIAAIGDLHCTDRSQGEFRRMLEGIERRAEVLLLAGDLTTLEDPGKDRYPGKKFGDEFPLAWRHEFEGGRAWYTALGHQKEHYSDPKFMQHILGGIRWAVGEKKG